MYVYQKQQILIKNIQWNCREGGNIVLFITLVPKVFIERFLSVASTTYCILIGWFIRFGVQTFQPLIVIYRRGKFVYHHWECKSFYRPLSYLIPLDSCNGLLKLFSFLNLKSV